MNMPPNFSISELTFSQTAARNSIDNTPDDEVLINLTQLAWTLQEIRDGIKSPIIVSSGYRGLALNTAIGGSKTSAHMKGMAADISTPSMTPLELAQWVAENIAGYDQIIHEFGRWVHLGLAQAPRGQLLTAMKEDGKTVYKHGLIEV